MSTSEFMTADELIAKLKVTSVEEMRKEYPYGVMIEKVPYTHIRCIQVGDDSYKAEVDTPIRNPMTARQLDKLTDELVKLLQKLLKKYEWVFKPNPSDALQVWLMGKRQDHAASLFARGTQKGLEDALTKLGVLAEAAKRIFGEDHPSTLYVASNWAALAVVQRPDLGKLFISN